MVRVPMWLAVLLTAFFLSTLVIVTWVVPHQELASLDRDIHAHWTVIQKGYAAPANLASNLIEAASSVGKLERETHAAISKARASVDEVAGAAAQNALDDPAAFRSFQRAQDALSSALLRLEIAVARSPGIQADPHVRDLETKLVGTEMGITVRRMRFNEAVQAFNAQRKAFPVVITASFLFSERPRFDAEPGAEQAAVAGPGPK